MLLFQKKKSAALRFLPMVLMLWAVFLSLPALPVHAQDVLSDLEFFTRIQDRSAGTPGNEEAADYILKAFEDAGLKEVGSQEFMTPIPEVLSASLEVNGETYALYPWGPNLVYLPKTPAEGLSGPLIYAADGDFVHFNGRTVEGSIVLMEMTSRSNWLNASMLGAKALIFIGSEDSVVGEFSEKNTPTPLAFPRYWVPPETGRKLKELAKYGLPLATVKSDTRWENKVLKNIYGFVPGKNPERRNELIVLDAFYDSSSHILGLAPGADEATSIAVMLSLARKLAKAPPDRTVLFLAMNGNGSSLAGMRQFIWTATTRKKLLRKESKRLQEEKRSIERLLDLIEAENPLGYEDPRDSEPVWQLVVEKARDKADALTREQQYQKALRTGLPLPQTEDPRPYRRLSWITTQEELTPEQRTLALKLIKEAKPDLRSRRKELKIRYQVAKSTAELRSILDDYSPVLFLSLYLSSQSSRLGLVEMGETYPVRENVRRVMRATRLSNILGQLGSQVARETGLPDMIRSVGRGDLTQNDSGKPAAGTHACCDVGALAGLPVVSLMSLDDSRPFWSTPNDTLDRVDKDNIEKLSQFLQPLFLKLFSHPSLQTALEGGIRGLASLEGKALFIRQGELFPDQPAPGTIISVLQGTSVFRAMAYSDGSFFMPGLANSRVSLEKLILEPYGLDPQTGRVAWTADKVKTGKVNYRIKVKTDLASTTLTMFHCLQSDIVQVFNPQKMSYLTKVELLDAATEAAPLRYWYSRVDGRNTMAVSVFLEKGTRFKLLMAESLLHKEFFLLNGSSQNIQGKGFLIGEPQTILHAPHRVGEDLHLLLGSRLKNLSQHGIVNRHLESLYRSSQAELNEARDALTRNDYGSFWSQSVAAWAKLNVIYREIEGTQRDVLAGVMFFVALFVPFAFCMERYLFAFRNVYQQLCAFLTILVITILAVRALHPAFQLTYSPMVVIIAFFIVGLSLLVSWIIFMRFEREMAEVHSRTAHLRTPQASKWQSFGAGFSIGVSNLNRRKLRTGLTSITLIILTFTVMSFTNVKSLHRTTQTRIAETAPYEGILIRHQYRLPLTILTLEDLKTRFFKEGSVWPKAWLEPANPADRLVARVHSEKGHAPAEGILGLGPEPPGYFQQAITSGRWFSAEERDAILLPLKLAAQLRLDPQRDVGARTSLMGASFRVMGFFDGSRLEAMKDLDQNPITPAYLEVSQSDELSEIEVEAMQSGEEVLPSTERFRYANADATVIIPFETCLNLGGGLRGITLLTSASEKPIAVADKLASWMAFPLFVGENGTWYHSTSTTLRYQGVANLLVPILIVIFITLNTMIGHVHERQREIGTYTSVGLAPTHVGFLFIVEAMSLAVISTVIGYILAQLSAKYLGNTAAFSQLTFNYSSLASVACMFLVFSVVFLAALYPARMAAQIAMPDVNRSWTLPPAEGDIISMNLPFLLKHEEESGIMAFLKAFYDSHKDVAHESFLVDDLSMDVDTPEPTPGQMPAPVCLLIRTNTWLAPFDFGIKQRIQIHCCPSLENPGYLEIAIQMIRLSGEHSAWVRANKNFIKALRKQMLLWRLLDQEAKAAYSDQRTVESAPI